MQVETYEVEEATSNHPEVTEEVSKLIDELGLVGQLDIATSETGAPVPYRKMTEDEQFAYGQLMPAQTAVEAYKSGPIPLRVLQVLAYARSLNFFQKFEVWHPEDARIDDPILVGITKHERGWGEINWLLARWGDCLKPFEEMLVLAGRHWRDTMIAAAHKALGQVQAELTQLEACPPDKAHALRRSSMATTPTYHGVLERF